MCLLTAAGIAGSFDIPVVVMAAAVTLVFLSQRPYAQLVSNAASRRDPGLLRRNMTWLAGYWVSTLLLFAGLYFVYDLVALPRFLWIAIPIAAAFTLFLWKNRVRSVAGELTGICGLTLTAPLTIMPPSGRFNLSGSGCGHFASFILAAVFLCEGSRWFLSQVTPQSHRRDYRTTRACVLYHGGLILVLASLVSLNRIPPLTVVAFCTSDCAAFWEFQHFSRS
jgi:hypothetical protein